MMKTKRTLGIAAIVSIAVAFLFLASAAAPAMSSNQANAFTSQANANLLPNPTLNSNITWSTYYSGWSTLEYNNGTSNTTLDAQPSAIYQNPITVLPQDIVANGTLQNDKIAGSVWNNGTITIGNAVEGGSAYSTGYSSIGNVREPYIQANTSKAAANGYWMDLPKIDLTSLPSSNPEYDYVTVGIITSGAQATGISSQIYISNGTATIPLNLTASANQALYESLNLKQIEQENNKIGLNTSGKGALSYLQIEPLMNLPASTSTSEYKMQLFAYAITPYPILLGETSTGQEPNTIIGSAQLSSLTLPKGSTIYNGGYTVAVSQPLQNLTTSQNAISDGNYIEQVEYQGQFELPTAPDLSYAQANISEQFNVSTSQTQVLDINGVSYLSAISTKNGTVTLLSSGNPNSQTQFLQIVDYTQSQWNSISSPPGIFSIAGIEYYWWIAVGGLATLIGLAGAAKHAGTKADQERIRRGGGGR